MDISAYHDTTYGRINRQCDEARKQFIPLPELPFSVWIEIGESPNRPTENMAFWRYANAVWKEAISCFHELKAEIGEARQQMTTTLSPHHKMPLRVIHEEQGVRLEWLDMGKDLAGRKHIAKVLVPIEIEME